MKKFFVFFGLFLFLIVTFNNSEAKNCLVFTSINESTFNSILKDGGFSGVIDAKTSLKFFGCYKKNDTELGIYIYNREFGNQRLTQRLLVVSGEKKYLGMYAIPESPVSIDGFNIVFPFPSENGNTISLENGEPPKQVLLDGEEELLFK